MNKRESYMEVYPTHTSKPYQGWRNRETWIVAASIGNDENLRDQVEVIKRGAVANRFENSRETIIAIASRLEKTFPIVHCGGVDWEAIAEMVFDGEM